MTFPTHSQNRAEDVRTVGRGKKPSEIRVLNLFNLQTFDTSLFNLSPRQPGLHKLSLQRYLAFVMRVYGRSARRVEPPLLRRLRACSRVYWESSSKQLNGPGAKIHSGITSSHLPSSVLKTRMLFDDF